MKLLFEHRTDFPKLVWLAECSDKTGEVTVYHGRNVETGTDFCVAGVWDGNFSDGGFDQSDIVAGTGVRMRNNRVVFVTPANTLDRISFVKTDNGYTISNALSALFAREKLEPVRGHDYQKDFETVIRGIRLYNKTIPTTSREVSLVYFNNLAYDGKTLAEIEKPDCVPHFSTFAEYNDFLFSTAEKLDANARAFQRKFPIQIVSTCSSGYDSSLATVIAKHMGSSKVLSIANAQSGFNRPDSGEKVAQALGLPCEVRSSIQKNYKNEEAIWASMGEALDLHFTVFDYPQPVSLLLTAFHGDMMWERTPFDLTEFLHRHDPSGASFSEWGLVEGVIHMSIGFWAIRRGKEIQALSLLEEMKPWTLFNNYDRPIPRRIIETAGVRRGDFAKVKRVAAIASDWLPNPWPYSENLKKEFKQFAQDNNIPIPHSFTIALWRLYNRFHWHVFRRIGLLFGKEDLLKISWAPFKTRWVFWYWAILKLKRNYSFPQ